MIFMTHKAKNKNWTITVHQVKDIEVSVNAKTKDEALEKFQNGDYEETDSKVYNNDVKDIYSEDE